MSTAPVRIGQRIEVQIDRLAFGGAGLGRYQGLVFFVRDTCPGDLVVVEVTKVKKSFAEARLIQLREFGPARVTPQCPVFDTCGGCQWQHISYAEQIAQKQDILVRAMEKAKVSSECVLPILQSPSPWRYRNRIQLHKQGGTVGFRSMGTHNIVSIQDCLIAEESVAEKIPSLGNAKDGRIDIRITNRGTVEIKDGGEVPELGFAQVNSQQNQVLIETARSWCQAITFDGVLDLYSGAGNLTFPLADESILKQAIGVELNGPAVQLGQKTAESHAGKIEFLQSDVLAYLKKLKLLKWGKEKTLVVLDPPRTGCGPEVIEELLRLQPNWILYVSCDPMTWLRDVQSLTTRPSAPYLLKTVQALDMFPQTSHIEVLSFLTRSTSQTF